MSIFKPIIGEESIMGNVAHAHSSSGFVHFHVDEIAVDTSYILIDISDTDFYNHTETYLVHLDKIFYRVDASVNASYIVSLWVLSDLTDTDCTRTMFWSESGRQASGVNIQGEEDFHPYGPLLKGGQIATNRIETGYTGYNLLTPMKSTKDVTTANVIPGNDDIIIEFDLNNNNSIEPHLNVCYHTHSQFHP